VAALGVFDPSEERADWSCGELARVRRAEDLLQREGLLSRECRAKEEYCDPTHRDETAMNGVPDVLPESHATEGIRRGGDGVHLR